MGRSRLNDWRASKFSTPPRTRLEREIGETVVYAIGDVHGCLDLLQQLEDMLKADAASLPGKKLIVMLGDYIDRGPASAQTIAHLMVSPPAGFERICLTGNHEIAMLDYLNQLISLEDWVSLGADATLQSYGLEIEPMMRAFPDPVDLDAFIRKSLPEAHIEFLRNLPILLDTSHILFVHAGIDPTRSIADQSDDDLVYIRGRFLESPEAMPKLIVHGHTPVPEARASGMRLDLDTGAFKTGRLTAARFYEGNVRVLSTI